MARNIKKSTGAKRERNWTGPLLFSYGFRPFFLFGPLFALLAMINWLLVLGGGGLEPAGLGALEWHIHEMLFGYPSALIAGFLLTAVPNWTGRLPVIGWPLLTLALIWVLGRVAMLFVGGASYGLLAVLDILFLLYFAAMIGREIISGHNWKNLKVLIPIGVLGGANIWFHVDIAGGGGADGAIRLGFSAILVLIMLIGGRVIPSFTRNWMARQTPGRMPVPFNRFDATVIGVSVFGMLWWVFLPGSVALGALLIGAGALHIVRLWRWAGVRCMSNPLLVVLHVFYAFVPLGFVTLGLAVALDDPQINTAAMHLFGVGAIGGMTMAVSLRAALGHTGRPLAADRGLIAIFVLIALAALVRALGAVMPDFGWLVTLAGYIWIAAFGLVTFKVGPWMLRPRLGQG